MEQILANTFDSRIHSNASFGSRVGCSIILATFDSVPGLILVHGSHLCCLLHFRAE